MGGCCGVDVGDGEAVDGVGHALARGDGFGAFLVSSPRLAALWNHSAAFLTSFLTP